MRSMKGFTIIELMLAMSFISVLLLAIAMTAIQAGRIYNKGLVLESVNQAGRDISDTLRRDFLQSNANNIISVPPIPDGGHDRSGRLCLGSYSYLWNIPTPAEASASSLLVKEGGTGDPINFVRVVDQGGSLCIAAEEGGYISELPTSSSVTHLLKKSATTAEVVLAIHDLTVTPIVVNEGDGLYRIEFTIGTSDTSEITDSTCNVPSDLSANDEFCAINNFEMIVRTNGQ